VRGEGGRGKRGTNRTYLWPWARKWWTEAAHRRWHRAGAGCGWWWRCSDEEEGAGTGRAASVWGGEGNGRVDLDNVGAEWCVNTWVATRWSWVRVASSGTSGGAFIGARGRMAASWAARKGATRGQNRRCGCLAITGGARRGASSTRGRRMPPRGGFLRGKNEILWASGGFSRCWQVHMNGQPRLNHGVPASWPAGDGIGQREERGGRRWWDLCAGSKNSRGWVKYKLKLILPKVKLKTFEYHFCSTFQDVHFIFYDYFHLSNV
jgi:hypothetical protein